MNGPTVLLCVGAQKAGTTWLHRYVIGADGAAAALMKEFHVWNSIYPGGDEPPIIFEGKAAPQRHELHRAMVEQPERYFDYFAELLGRRGSWLATDMTPAYAGLPAEAFERVRAGFLSRGIALRVVFLMRDPVERCWSAVRMYRQKTIPLPRVQPNAVGQEALQLYCRTGHAQRHGRYDRTVKVLESVFPASELYFGIYETLFNPDSLRSLSRFIGIEPRTEFLERRFNVSIKEERLSAETYRTVASAYADSLGFCWDRFPGTRKLWKSYAALEVPEKPDSS